MRDGWEALPFGEVLELDIRRAGLVEGKAYPIVGVLAYGRGLLYRQPVSTRSTSYRELNVIRPNQLVYSKLKAFEGAIAVAPTDLVESYASGEFPTFTMKDRVLPTFVRVMTQRKELWEAMAGHSKGMGGRRERLNPIDFLSLVAKFPPLPEQRRIVDLIGALDDTIAAANTAHASLASKRATSNGVEGSLLALLLSDQDVPRQKVEALGTVTMGRQRSPEHATGTHMAPYLRVANVSDDALRMGDVLRMNFTPDERRRYSLQRGDILVSEGQSLELVGESVLLEGTFPESMCFQNTLIRFRPDPAQVRPPFAQALFRAALRAGIFSGIAKRTTTIAHLEVVPLPVELR